MLTLTLGLNLVLFFFCSYDNIWSFVSHKMSDPSAKKFGWQGAQVGGFFLLLLVFCVWWKIKMILSTITLEMKTKNLWHLEMYFQIWEILTHLHIELWLMTVTFQGIDKKTNSKIIIIIIHFDQKIISEAKKNARFQYCVFFFTMFVFIYVFLVLDMFCVFLL